jgi:hypothetical protein
MNRPPFCISQKPDPVFRIHYTKLLEICKVFLAGSRRPDSAIAGCLFAGRWYPVEKNAREE